MRIVMMDNKKHIKSHKGFTLLETVLAVALLLIVTVFIYHGFMSTIHYSTNTAVYEKTAQNREGAVKSGLGSTPIITSLHGLYIEDPGASANDKVIIVTYFTGGATYDTLDSDPTYSESNNPPPVHRSGFSFVQRPCPVSTCGGYLRWYEAADGNIYEMCSDPDCDYHTGP